MSFKEFKPYPKYKDSGVEWLGEIPEHWNVAPLKRSFKIVGGSTPKSEQEAYWDGALIWITPSDLSKLSSMTINDSQRKITVEGLASCGTTLVPPGSIVLSTRAPIGSLAIAGTELCTNQGCKSLVPFVETQSKFYGYLLSISTGELNIRGKGTTFLELSGDDLGAFKVGSPPREEQTAIASFLDQETSRIDTLISEKERLISLLQEYRQALISHAVTKGLDPKAKMKDSGVEWLGEIPEHWETKKLKNISPQITVGIVVEPSKYYVDDGVPALRSLNISSGSIMMENFVYISKKDNEFLSKSRLNTGDLVVVRSGQPGTTAVIPSELNGCNCIDLIIIRKPIDDSENYLCLFMNSDLARLQVTLGIGGAIQQHFNVGMAQNIVVPLPPLSEQLSISSFLDHQTSRTFSVFLWILFVEFAHSMVVGHF